MILRLLLRISLYLLIAFTLIGVLISRPWGWSEYASDELYVVYFQVRNAKPEYFIVNADGSSKAERLSSSEGTIIQVDCSPDGRNLAFLTDKPYLYVLNEKGLIYSRLTEQEWNMDSTANNEYVSLFNHSGGNIIVDQNSARTLSDLPGFQLARISSHGLVLWEDYNSNVLALSNTSGNIIRSFPKGVYAQWLADEQSFVFVDPLTMDEGGTTGEFYVGDVSTETTVPLQKWNWYSLIILSPDRTQIADRRIIYEGDGGSQGQPLQVVVYDTLANQNLKQLTDDKDISSTPLCFLTFRPQMLLADNP